MGKFILSVCAGLLLAGCVTADNPAVRSQYSGQYESRVVGIAKPALFGVFYTFVSHEAWPSGYTSYFPGTSQDTRYPGQCGPVPFNPNEGDRFNRNGTTSRC